MAELKVQQADMAPQVDDDNKTNDTARIHEQTEETLEAEKENFEKETKIYIPVPLGRSLPAAEEPVNPMVHDPSATYRRMRDKYYPQKFCPWTSFPAEYEETFRFLIDSFGEARAFPSPLEVQRSEDIIIESQSFPGADLESMLKTFHSEAVTKPAATILSAHLQLTGHPAFKTVVFRNKVQGIARNNRSDSKAAWKAQSWTRGRPVNQGGVPDRWAIAVGHDDKEETNLLVADFRHPHMFTSDLLQQVLNPPPDESFFSDVAKTDAECEIHEVFRNRTMSKKMYVAYAIGQTYHCMVTAGLEYGYVTAANTMVFLRVPQDDPRTLYYHLAVFPIPPKANIDDWFPAPKEIAVTHVASMLLWATRTAPPRLSSWIAAAKRHLRKWPLRYDYPPEATEEEAEQQRGSETKQWTFVAEPPALPYCTMACLRSLCKQLPLDEKCPNVELHRAAHSIQSTSENVAGRHNHHPLTVEELREKLVVQIETNMDKDCACLVKDGLYGQRGVMLKLTLTGYGYTFMGKGVQEAEARSLECEDVAYRGLEHVQGRLIPVYLGTVKLLSPYPLHTCAEIPQLLLISYAGVRFHELPSLPGRDLHREEQKTYDELTKAGFWSSHHHHHGNMVWSDEVNRVVFLDFGHVHLRVQDTAKEQALDKADGGGETVKKRTMDDANVADGDNNNAKRAQTEEKVEAEQKDEKKGDSVPSQ